MQRITALFGLTLLLWLGLSPVAAFTRAESKAANMAASLQTGHDFPLAALELLAAFIVLQPKTALRGGGAENQALTWDVTLVIHYKHKGYPARIARIVLGPVVTPDYRTPDIYDPSTFTEPYAYAAGNPMLYWDPDGLRIKEYSDGRVGIIYEVNGKEREILIEKEAWLALILGKVQIGNLKFQEFSLPDYPSLAELKEFNKIVSLREDVIHDQVIELALTQEKALFEFFEDSIIDLIGTTNSKDLPLLVNRLKQAGFYDHIDFSKTGSRFTDLAGIEIVNDSQRILYTMVLFASQVDNVSSSISATSGVAAPVAAIFFPPAGAVLSTVSTTTGFVSAGSKLFIAQHTNGDYSSGISTFLWVGAGATLGHLAGYPLRGAKVKQARYGTGYTFQRGPLIYTGKYRPGQFIPKSLVKNLEKASVLVSTGVELGVSQIGKQLSPSAPSNSELLKSYLGID